MPSKEVKLLVEERRREIARLVLRDGRVSVEDLARRYKVSAVTLRADLGRLAAQGMIVRSYGGAILPNDRKEDYPLKVKQTIHHAEKVRIGRAAARFIDGYQTVILDSGTTAAEVARAIKRSKVEALTVITHALNIAQEFIDHPRISVIMIGGLMRNVSGSFVGPQAERLIRELHADHCFLGVDGIDAQLNLSTPDLLEAQLNKLMMQVSQEVTVVADASKVGRRSLSIISHVKNVRRLITDDSIRPEMRSAIEEQGVEVITA